MITETISQWGGTIVETLEDIITGYFQDASEALKAAITIERRSGQKHDKKSWFPVRILIHHGDASLEDGSLRGEAATFLTKFAGTVKYGHIYVSKELWTNIRDLKTVEFQPVADANRTDAKLFDVIWHPETDCRPKGAAGTETAVESDTDISQQFVHGANLVQGDKPRCFYCGSRRHLTSACPSKQLPNTARGMEQLGYLSLDEMNDLFSDYLRNAGDELPVVTPSSGAEQEYFLAPLSFYDLKKPFQLRFVYAVWNARSKDEWHKVRESKKESSNEGGMLWLALDCIRTSQLEQAEDLLIRHSQRTVKDYRLQCGLAITRIEKGNYSEAVNLLNEVLGFELTSVQRVHVLLLLYRVHEVIGDQSRAYEKLRDALRVESFCPEAIFLDVARQFNEKRSTEAATRLLKLVQVFREYYPAALISPDLADFQDVIVPELSKVKEKIRAEGKEAAGEADREIESLKKFLDVDDRDFSQIVDMYNQMRESWARPKAFFNCWDTAYLGKKIADLCRVLDQERVRQAEKAIDKLEARYNAAAQQRFARTTGKLRTVAAKIAELRAGLEKRQSFDEGMKECKELSKTLDLIDTMVQELQQKKEFYAAIYRFVRHTATILLISAVVALVLFPVAVYCIETFWPGMTPFYRTDIWQTQKAILSAGIVIAFLGAGMAAASRAHSGRNGQQRPAKARRPAGKTVNIQPARNTRGRPGKRK
jgi:tetratricopeptide (TPR) repeat protein